MECFPEDILSEKRKIQNNVYATQNLRNKGK